MTTSPTRTGGCHCGAVRLEISAEPIVSVVCHCTDCARISGAAGHAINAFPRDAVTIAGAVTWYESPGDSGKMVRRGFCPRCGTRLFGYPELVPQLMSVSALSFDDASGFRPQVNVYMASAVPWAVTDPAVPSFDRMPPVPGG